MIGNPAPALAPTTVPTPDGRTLYAERGGTGAPVVVFEAGMGASRSSWGAVVPPIAARTTTVVYDRSGLGRSAPAGPGHRRDLDDLVEDLLAVLDHVGPGPFVLVGHSWGGPIVRVAASRRPDAVAGLVLVDVTDEGCELFFSPAAARQTRMSRWVMPMLARLGVLRAAVKKLARHLPEPAATNLRAEDGTMPAVREQLAELEHHVEDLRRLRAEPPVLPDVPVTYVSGTKASRLEGKRRPELLATHRAAAAALPQGRFVEAPDSSHYVPLTDAPLVVAEIERILDVLDQAGSRD